MRRDKITIIYFYVANTRYKRQHIIARQIIAQRDACKLSRSMMQAPCIEYQVKKKNGVVPPLDD